MIRDPLRLTTIERKSLQDSTCPKCGSPDHLRLTRQTRMIDCTKCRHIFKLKLKED